MMFSIIQMSCWWSVEGLEFDKTLFKLNLVVPSGPDILTKVNGPISFSI